MVQDGVQYNLVKKLSENELTEAWLGQNKSTGKSCFLKCVNSNSDRFTEEFKNNTTLQSYNLQRKLYSSRFLIPVGKVFTNGSLMIEYPYLSPDIWEPLTFQKFSSNLDFLLPEICLTIDLLHGHNLIHCDIKLENFLVHKSTNKIKLVDLDFITENRSPGDAIIKGTNEYISPEMIKNTLVNPAFDYYSLGIILEKSLDSFEGDIQNRVSKLSEILKSKQSSYRVHTLIEMLHKNDLIDDTRLIDYTKTLFSSYILSCLKSQLSQKHKKYRKVITEAFATTNHILGFNEEIISLLADLFAEDRRSFVSYLKNIIQHSQIDRIGDFWICKPPLDILRSVVGYFYSYAEIDELKKIISLLLERKLFYIPYLILRSDYADLRDKVSQEEREYLLLKLYKFSNGHNNLQEAAHYLETLLDEYRAETPDTIYYDLAVNYIQTKEFKKADKIIQSFVSSESPDAIKLKFKSLNVYMSLFTNRMEQAEEMALEIIDEASEIEAVYAEVVSRYYLGVTYYMQNDFARAITLLKKSLQLATNAQLFSLINSSQISLSTCFASLHQYKQSLVYIKKSLKGLEHLENIWKKHNIYTNLYQTSLTLSKFDESKKYLYDSLSGNISPDEPGILLTFYLNKGYYHLSKSELDLSREALLTLLQLKNEKSSRSTVAEAYINLIILSMYQDNQKDLAAYYISAKEIYTELNSAPSLVRMEFFHLINKRYNLGESCSVSSLKSLYNRFVDESYILYSVKCLFFALLDSIEQSVELKFDYQKISYYFKDQEIPFIKATALLLSSQEKLHNTNHLIFILKETYKVIYASGDKFISALVADLIGVKYESIHNHKLALKFYQQSLVLFEELKNCYNTSRLQSKIEDVSTKIESSDTKLEIIRDISELLKNVNDYENGLKQILQFTLNLTGAERAVLLYKSEGSNDLRIKAYLNCDENSLEDIEKYSTSITLKSYQESEPIIIDNALEDDRIKSYNSIIAHNIQSVISIPIMRGNEIFGVLYLDHQTIPALFDKNDIDFAFTLANLLSLMFSVFETIKNYKITNMELVSELVKSRPHKNFITQNKTMLKIFERLPNIAKSNASVLLLGESGTGKEIIAEMIHALSNRPEQPLVKINCTSLSDNLIESELFGIESNVATDVKGRDGKLYAADSGTLFMDEIGDMPLQIQTKILRAIEYQEFEKVGSNRTIRTDIRFIYATNKDLKKLREENKFRDDLYYRIQTLPIYIPPLRERKDDIPLLIDSFIKYFTVNNNPPNILPEVKGILMNYHWPGNVRELKNLIERFCIVHQGQAVDVSNIPDDILSHFKSYDTEDASDIIEKQQIIRALERNNGIESRAAKEMDIPLSTFRRKMNKYGLK